MRKQVPSRLSRRERQIMDAVYALGEATVAEVVEQMDDPPSYDSVRVTLGILVKKGHLNHTTAGRRYVFKPTVSREKAMDRAVGNLSRTFFQGSTTQAILALLDRSSHKLTDKDLDELAAWVEEQRDETEDR
jgi:predicted transcriptional regulator